jgi:hypothetical protein
MRDSDTIGPTWRSIAMLLLLLAAPLQGAQGDPAFISDEARLLSPAQARRIVAMHRALHAELAIHLHLMTLPASPGDLDAAAAAIFDRLGLGTRGLLLLVDPAGQAVRLEVGYDLEQLFTDAFVGGLERDQMAPFFRAGRVGPGVEATVELLVARAGGRVAPAEDSTPLTHGSGGGGARLHIAPGAPPPPAPFAEREALRPGGTPEETLATYRRVLSARIKDPDLPLYTPDTRRFLASWLVTDAQQANELRGLERHLAAACTLTAGERAVVRFPAAAREQPPYFFAQGAAGWELDLAAMGRLIRFNHRNQWHFTTLDHPYRFAFAGERFDRNGFLLPVR